MRIHLLLPCLLVMQVSAQDSLNVRSLFNWQDPSIPIGFPDLANQFNEVWGYSAGGREYALLGSTLGVHVFDVTDPAASVMVDHVPGRFSGAGVIHRDYKTYLHYLYATCDQGPSSLQIMDLQYLPDSVHVVYDSDALFARAHNIQIDTVHARLYTCGGSSQFSIYSLENPVQPVLLKNLQAEVPWWNATVGYVHDCFVRDNIVWTNDEDGLHVIDFSNVDQPQLLGSLTSYAYQGYNHSGWMNDDGTLYVMADETHGSPLKFVDPTDLSDLQVISTVTSGVHPLSIVHNPFFHGNMVHVAYYYDGYWLWDASDPLQPALIGYYDTNETFHSNSYVGAWGVYPYLPSGNILVSDMQSGLWVLQVGPWTGMDTPSEQPAFRVHPTITDGPLKIQRIMSGRQEMHVRIFDAAGRIVHQTRHGGGHTTLQLDALKDGAYVVKVSSEGREHVQRIIKNSIR
jgi:choice-of-anchor B domain-containing protein